VRSARLAAVIDLFLALTDRIATGCGNLFSFGTSDGVSPRRALWVEIGEVALFFGLLAAAYYFDFLI
jgi:hypothetical protein